jgi:hypothetical protein
MIHYLQLKKESVIKECQVYIVGVDILRYVRPPLHTILLAICKIVLFRNFLHGTTNLRVCLDTN